MSGVPDASVYRRAPRLVWRLVGASVLTHAIDGHPQNATAELTGWAARVWVALDEPADIDELHHRLELRAPEIDDAVRQMVAAGLVHAR